ncbi:hypothetical protein TYRP_001193 [Tyrophagus putrescentiae]|nr:hypothetical protein TYRP_001193 [Tyrophagus putrescentiae]
MKYIASVALLALLAGLVSCQTKPAAAPAATAAPAAPAPVPVIVWGNCPQLEPSEEDKKSKAKVLQECLQEHPIPKEVTEESIGKHQANIAECALKKENWFETDGSYKFDKAASEIKKKNLSKSMEASLLTAHGKCKSESSEMAKEPKMKGAARVQQVQFYQSCMDFHITKACDIKIQTAAAAAPAPKP